MISLGANATQTSIFNSSSGWAGFGIPNMTGTGTPPTPTSYFDMSENTSYAPVLIITYEDTGSGLINNSVGAVPFYQSTTNPINISLNATQSAVVTWYVNATGRINSSYLISAYANITSNNSVNDITESFNITIIQVPSGATTYTRDIFQSIYFSNLLSRVGSFSKEISQLLTFSNLLSRTSLFLRDASQTFLISSSINRMQSFSRDIFQTFTISAISERVVTFSRGASQLLTFSLVSDRIAIFSRDAFQSVYLTGVIEKSMQITIPIFQVIHFSLSAVTSGTESIIEAVVTGGTEPRTFLNFWGLRKIYILFGLIGFMLVFLVSEQVKKKKFNDLVQKVKKEIKNGGKYGKH